MAGTMSSPHNSDESETETHDMVYKLLYNIKKEMGTWSEPAFSPANTKNRCSIV